MSLVLVMPTTKIVGFFWVFFKLIKKDIHHGIKACGKKTLMSSFFSGMNNPICGPVPRELLEDESFQK